LALLTRSQEFTGLPLNQRVYNCHTALISPS
jgi:hypothetical protein